MSIVYNWAQGVIARREKKEKAKELLENTSNKIISISEACGYNEVYYFSHSFKKYTGQSPKKYRESLNV